MMQFIRPEEDAPETDVQGTEQGEVGTEQPLQLRVPHPGPLVPSSSVPRDTLAGVHMRLCEMHTAQGRSAQGMGEEPGHDQAGSDRRRVTSYRVSSEGVPCASCTKHPPGPVSSQEPAALGSVEGGVGAGASLQPWVGLEWEGGLVGVALELPCVSEPQTADVLGEWTPSRSPCLAQSLF